MEKDLEGSVISVAKAAKLFGLSRATAYRAIHNGRFPVEVIRVGGRLVVPTAPLRRLLGLEEPKSA